jgi:hypothetical protein
MKHNDTTMRYPREAGHHHPKQEWMYGPYTSLKKNNPQEEFWVCITLAFAAGFLFKLLWG